MVEIWWEYSHDLSKIVSIFENVLNIGISLGKIGVWRKSPRTEPGGPGGNGDGGSSRQKIRRTGVPGKKKKNVETDGK